MVERIHEYFYLEPERITGLGKFVALLGSFLFVAGVVGKVATVGVNILPTLQKHPETTKMLADIYPTLFLWWVPESLLVAIGAGALVIVGICLNAHGKRIDRLLKN